jgi:hypothetical protein
MLGSWFPYVELLTANRGTKDVRIHAVVVPELKFGDVQRHIFFADVAERADNPVVQFPVAPDSMSSPANHPEKRAEVRVSGMKGAMQCQ